MWTLWLGNTKDEGPVQEVTKDFYELEKASADFDKRFIEKTGNKWADREFFEEKPGKFAIVDEGKEEQRHKNAQEAETQVSILIRGYDDAKSSLPSHGLDLARFIFDYDHAKRTLRAQGLDVSQLPFGLTSESRLTRAFKILAEVQRLLVE